MCGFVQLNVHLSSLPHCHTPYLKLSHPLPPIATPLPPIATPLTSHCHTPYLPLPHPLPPIATPLTSHCHTPYLPLPHPLPPVKVLFSFSASILSNTLCWGYSGLTDLLEDIRAISENPVPMVTSLALPPSRLPSLFLPLPPPILPLLTAPPEVSLMSAVGLLMSCCTTLEKAF